MSSAISRKFAPTPGLKMHRSPLAICEAVVTEEQSHPKENPLGIGQATKRGFWRKMNLPA